MSTWGAPKTWDGLTAFERRAPRVRRIAFLINGKREYITPPIDPAMTPDPASEARELIEELGMDKRGRVTLFIETDNSNVVRLVQRGMTNV